MRPALIRLPVRRRPRARLNYDGDPLLGSGFAVGADALRGLSDVVTFDVGDGHVVIAGTDLNFRTWPRVAWTVVANASYHGPSGRVTAD